MKVLGIDTSAGVASVAITENGKILSSFTLDSGNTHSKTLLPMIEASFDALSIGASDVDLFAVSSGPGSFTGVRIGAATAKGLAHPHNTPCIGVSSLEAMAENLRSLKGIICPVINARSSRVYCAIFKSNGSSLRRLTEDDAMPIEELFGMLAEYADDDIYFVGDAYELVTGSENAPSYLPTPAAVRQQNAAGVASLGERLFREATGDERERMTPEALSVTYLRKPQAEREREERLASNK